MTRQLLTLAVLFSIGAVAVGDPIVGPGMRRVEDMADGAPAFVVLDARGVVVRRVECINNHQYDPDALAAHFLGSTAVLDRVVATNGRIGLEDLGPASFDCIVVTV